jgi:excisionase family DNA binding protein
MSYVSTGQAAKLLSVTPDAVLKWIKKGKLRARRTPGGHYRVSRDSVFELLSTSDEGPFEGAERWGRPFVPCWEYNAIDGIIKEDCRTCLVFKARGEKCYEVGTILKERGEGATCCPSDCEDCAYYKEQLQRPLKILVFTESDMLKESLAAEGGSSKLRLQFTSSEYDCSLAVNSFRPEYVIVDCATEFSRYEKLCWHLADDPRIPAVRIIVALPPDKKHQVNLRGVVGVIDRPFNLAEIGKFVKGFDLL